MGWKWAPIGGLQYQTHMQAPKYDVQFLRSEALRSSSSSSILLLLVVAVAVAGRGKLKNVIYSDTTDTYVPATCL